MVFFPEWTKKGFINLNVMRRKPKIAIIIVGIIGAFVFSQYAAAMQLNVSMRNSEIVERTDAGTLYQINLEFENPSLMILNVGKTDFLISAEGENLGAGILDPTIIPPMDKIVVETPFLADNAVLDKYEKSDNTPALKLAGISRYNLWFTSLDIPFTYYPTQEEAREFIHGK